MEWKNIYRGLMIGAIDVVPGVSGGTVAIMLGIYDRLVEAINGFASRHWKKHLPFLVPLGIGVGTALLTISRLMKWLLENYPGPTYFFFIGLILGIIPFLFQEAEARQTFRPHHYGLLVIGIVLIGMLVFFKDPEQGTKIVALTFNNYVLLFISGILASAAMILPGISGSLVFLLMGVYQTVIYALSELHLLIIGVVGVGIVIGLVSVSKLVSYFFKRFGTETYAVIIGAVLGSIIVIFPGWPNSGMLMFASIVTFVVGLLVANLLGRVEYKETK